MQRIRVQHHATTADTAMSSWYLGGQWHAPALPYFTPPCPTRLVRQQGPQHALVRPVAGEQLPQHHAERKHVRLLADVAVQQQLGAANSSSGNSREPVG